jgi:predicted nuclease of predicted toxin-antitoxin system
MQFKIDENLPVEIAKLFSNAGYDAKTVHDQKLSGIKDQNLIDVCKKENRILITFDTDFSDIRTYPPNKGRGIIVLRISNQSKKYVLKVCKQILPLLEDEELYQHLWIVEDSRVRIRGDND